MNLFDLVILGFLLFFLFRGVKRGFVRETFSLLELVLSLYLPFALAGFGADVLQLIVKIPRQIATILAFILWFLFFHYFFFGFLVNKQLKKVINIAMPNWAEGWFGALVGLFKGLVIASFLAIFLSLIPFSQKIRTYQQESYLFYPVAQVAPALFEWAVKKFPTVEPIFYQAKKALEEGARKAAEEAARRR